MPVIALPALCDNYIWTIIHEETRSMFCVDPGDALPVLNYAKANQLSLSHILLTHHHTDHIGGVSELIQHFPAVIVYAPADQRIPAGSTTVYNEDIITPGPYCFQILATPGHTRSHISYQEPTQGWLFCGDTLFSAGCGRVFDGTHEELFASLNYLKSLPDHTKVFSAHEYTLQNLRFAQYIEPYNKAVQEYLAFLEKTPTQCSLPSTIGLEKEINPFLRAHTLSLEVFSQEEDPIALTPFLIFKHLRDLKDKFHS